VAAQDQLGLCKLCSAWSVERVGVVRVMAFFIQDLWAPFDALKSEAVAQTTAGVFECVTNFVDYCVKPRETPGAFEECRAHHERNVAGKRPETFRDALLHLAGLTNEGLVVATVAKGGAVLTLDACKAGGRARILSLSEARAMLREGTMAAVVDCDGQMRVTLHARNIVWLTIDKAFYTPPPPQTTVPARPAGPVSARTMETRELVEAAHAALVNGMWELSQRP